jgi:predicted dehydrogenase
MAGNKIGIGFVGLSAKDGWAARSHAPALKLNPDFEIRAITNSSLQSSEEAAKKYGAPLFFGSVAEMAARPEIDLVVVTVGVPSHRKAVDAALNAGKMVYCEWPLGHGLKDAEEMTALAKAKGVRNFVGLQGHSAPPVRYVRDLVAQGYVGEVLSTSVIASSGTHGPVVEPRQVSGLGRDSGHAMLNIRFSHTTDGICWALGEFSELAATMAVRMPQVKRADTGEMVPKTADDQIAVAGTLQGGAVASIHFRAGMSRGTKLLWEINGTKGDLLMTGSFGGLQYGQFKIEGGQGADKTLAELPVPAQYEVAHGATPKDPFYTLGQAYGLLLGDIRNGTSNVPTFADAVVRHRMVEAVERAAKSGKRESYDVKAPK